jgi:RIO kinase 2
MVSVDHVNAKEYFERDVKCIRDFFQKRFRYTADDEGPFWSDVRRVGKLDVEVEASGFSKKQAKELEKYMRDVAPLGEGNEGEQNNDEDDSDEEGKEEGSEEEEEEVEEKGNPNAERRDVVELLDALGNTRIA